MEQGRASAATASRPGAAGGLAIVLAAALVVGVVTQFSDGRPDGTAEATAPTTLAPAVSTPPTAAPAATSPPPTAAAPSIAPAVSRIETTEKVIFLGIDDGLVRDPAVLDFLQANRIPFSAFVVNGPLQADPAYWARARAIGGFIEAHTLTHPNLTKVSGDQLRNELCGSADAVEAATGRRPTLLRPPEGAYNDTVRAVAAQCGYWAVVLWKGSTNDGRVDFQENEIKPGDILLMHWRSDLLDNLKQVVAVTQSQGYKIGSLENYLGPVP